MTGDDLAEKVAAVLRPAVRECDEVALDNLHADWAVQSVADTLAAALLPLIREREAAAWERALRERKQHGVALDKGRGIVCLCGEVCNAVIKRSPARLLGSTSDSYVAVNAGTVFARHLQAVNDGRTDNPYAGSEGAE